MTDGPAPGSAMVDRIQQHAELRRYRRFFSIFPYLCDPNILQIGAVREGVSFACISGDVFLIKSEVRFGTSQ